ncbi:Heat shock transcription factor [Fasciolopsis buskii]|uniref:Heat shock transcription factor n=1 Tax=Fasciolopsis buskii TaxID=27845 RepID=A0A8E0S644_9TREM|nr:Heat shock transcription factor [Fasciolopsis buski]
MSTFDSDFASPTVPAFLTKLRLLVEDGETNDLIYWDPDGTSFHICDGNRLAKEILPLFFKHNNLSSFIRQLNMYGFRKVNRVDPNSAFKTELEDMEFKHPYFVRSKPHLMSKIQRKPHANIPAGLLFNGRTGSGSLSSYLSGSGLGPSSFTGISHPSHPATVADVERLYTIIRGLRSNQEAMNNQLTLVQSENQLLYRELTELRERHEQQSQLIQTVCLFFLLILSSHFLLHLQLFTFLSAFAKDNQSPNFRFGSGKRRALAFTPSRMFNAQSHSGLKLNLPQGFALDEYTKAMHPLQLDADDERLSAPYKIAKMDLRALPTNVQDNVQCLPSTSPEVINQTIYQYNSPQTQLIPGTSQSTNHSSDPQRLRPPCLNRLQHFEAKRSRPYALRNEPVGFNELAFPEQSTPRISVVSAVSDTSPTAFCSKARNDYPLRSEFKVHLLIFPFPI